MRDDIEENLRNNFESFFVQAFHSTHPDDDLEFEPYLEYICDRYQNLKKRTRLVINQPPRTLKSWTVKYYVAWYLGRRPSAKVMVITNTQRLSEQFTYDVRGILRKKWYRKLFPKMRIASDRSAVNRFQTTRGGAVFAGSVESSVAGFGADLLILDDPNKIEDASRPDHLQIVNQKFDGEIYSRIHNKKTGGIVIVVQHRLNDDDLSGHLIRNGYKSIILPLMAPRKRKYKMSDGRIWLREKGNILVPKAMSKKDIEKEKRVTTPAFFWFQQQGAGPSSEVSPIKPEYFHLIEHPIFKGPTVISIDAAQRDGLSNSYNVIQVWGETNKTYHLITQFREQCSFSDFEAAARRLIRFHRPAAILIENAANGVALISRLQKTLKHQNIKAVEPTGSKAERLNRHRATVRHGVISLPARADWLESYIDEFIKFPAGYSDQVDATTQYLDFMFTKPKLETPPPRAAIAVVNSKLVSLQPQVHNSQTAPYHPAGLALGSRFRPVKW